MKNLAKDTTVSFPQYADWLKEYAKTRPHPFIKDSSKMVSYCFELDKEVPTNYGWRFSTEDALKRQVESLKYPKEINGVYWKDQARNVEAYSMMSFWRGVELLKAAIRSLNIHEVVPAAVLARSLLELSTVYLTNANFIEKNFTDIQFKKNSITVSQNMEEMIVKMIWGTRFGEPEPHIKQQNVMTYLQKLSKNPKASGLLPTYEYLCDVAHPSFIGNTRYWSHVEERYEDGSERRIISRHAESEPTQELLDKILWSLGWSAACVRNSFELVRQGLSELLEKLEKS